MKCDEHNQEREYVGEHYDQDEGWCSTYVCKECSPEDYKYFKRAWYQHQYQHRKQKKHWCNRCSKEVGK